jgi:hypothetical protein
MYSVSQAAKVFAADQVTVNLPALVARTTAPAGDGVVSYGVGSRDRLAASFVRLVFFGTDAANETLGYRLTGWTSAGDIWVPSVLLVGVATLGEAVGLAGTTILDTHLIADTITTTAGMAHEHAATRLYAPADNSIASVLVPTLGFTRLSLDLAIAGGSAASFNAIANTVLDTSFTA